MKLIKISTDLELTVHEFPEGSHEQQNEFLRELIGNNCEIYEHVRPRRLYTELHQQNCPTTVPGQCVSMLVDEEGLLKDTAVQNPVGSYLYETDRHGHPIVGNILFVGEKWEEDCIAFCGIEESACKKLEAQLKDMVEEMKLIQHMQMLLRGPEMEMQ